MASQGYFSHYAPDGTTAIDLLDGYGVGYQMAGENIARSNYSANVLVDVVHSSWMASEMHRANILEGGYGHVGIAVAESGGTYYATVVFID